MDKMKGRVVRTGEEQMRNGSYTMQPFIDVLTTFGVVRVVCEEDETKEFNPGDLVLIELMFFPEPVEAKGVVIYIDETNED